VLRTKGIPACGASGRAGVRPMGAARVIGNAREREGAAGPRGPRLPGAEGRSRLGMEAGAGPSPVGPRDTILVAGRARWSARRLVGSYPWCLGDLWLNPLINLLARRGIWREDLGPLAAISICLEVDKAHAARLPLPRRDTQGGERAEPEKSRLGAACSAQPKSGGWGERRCGSSTPLSSG
jgi:hypothetical protein